MGWWRIILYELGLHLEQKWQEKKRQKEESEGKVSTPPREPLTVKGFFEKIGDAVVLVAGFFLSLIVYGFIFTFLGGIVVVLWLIFPPFGILFVLFLIFSFFYYLFFGDKD